jgi:hypothetical protein
VRPCLSCLIRGGPILVATGENDENKFEEGADDSDAYGVGPVGAGTAIAQGNSAKKLSLDSAGREGGSSSNAKKGRFPRNIHIVIILTVAALVAVVASSGGKDKPASP